MLSVKDLCRNIVVDNSAIVPDAESVLSTPSSTRSNLANGDMASHYLGSFDNYG